MTDEERVREATKLEGRIEVPLVRELSGSHTRLLSLLIEQFGGTWVYGKGRPGGHRGGVAGYRRMANSEGCRATTTGALAFAHHPERRPFR